MASAAEQLASNLNFSAFAKADELKRRLLFTITILIVYRFCTYVPLPGIDPDALARFFEQQRSMGGSMLDVVNVFSGGALQRMSIIALNIMPYISASIIMQLLTTMSPALAAMKKEGEAGRKKINQYTRYGTVLLTAVQGYGLALTLQSGGMVSAENAGAFFQASTVISLVGGTMLLMWLGEQISARGVGNGISLIIFAGIVAELPRAFAQIATSNMSTLATLALIAGAIGLIYLIVWVERAQRRILIQYPKRQMGNRMFQGDTSHLPLKLNTAGVIPPIFASSILLMPLTVASFSSSQDGGPAWVNTFTALLGQGQPLYLALFAAGIIFFAFFYTSIVFNPSDTADNLKKHGGFVPGIRPGKRTAEYINYVLVRLTVVGAIYLAIICTIPEFLRAKNAIPFALGGTSFLIMVNVTMDTVAQIHSHLLAHQYEGLIKKSKLRGGRKK
ncbi:protein translocase subunit secY/sec61 alpha [Rhodothalassium salexigens DSM 2132]|uniref:Protein translocase subunit SecY n=1 Tax=Rhodothalassium salexigens DSM 2132 TaxID=1188247 RepID=A0A4R2PAM3_RHOSA|nr:preprotein translocase subunit SecY [Rhodothalassium salexigens]MBB4212372.1 preprotein translocase subunit SecY [Rhodothalassium salexigens DSM 2132]MBK1637796.1 preprotein translocase subunit SecY [Rhodothalassium salexigens DSM 2132]TCP31997.1 protein translocase subunit secY/sec61 alpha [Rhodothalassium salexigens DSM 2132]